MAETPRSTSAVSSSAGAEPVVPTSARVLGAVGRGLITTGVVVLLFVVFQLWGTNFQEARAQDGLRDDFDDAFTIAQTQLAAFTTNDDGRVVDAGATTDANALPDPVTTLPGGFTPEVLRYFFPEDGDAVARIEIPSIGVDKIVVNGVQVTDLRKGPGHYPGTAAVGTAGNTSIAGHRTTYGAPFNRIDELAPGDEIHVTGVLGRFTYRVLDPRTAYADRLEEVDDAGDGHVIVRPGATWVLDHFDDNRVTLTACHPKLSSRQRIIVAAELVTAPVDAPEFGTDVIEAYLDATGDERSLPGESFDDGITGESGSDPSAATADLDEGLGGERDAIPGAIAWMVTATVLWVGFAVAARHFVDERRWRVAVRIASLMPVGICLWLSFELIDRALPAG